MYSIATIPALASAAIAAERAGARTAFGESAHGDQARSLFFSHDTRMCRM